MATREEMFTALRAADAAGATEDAQRIAQMIAATPQVSQESPGPTRYEAMSTADKIIEGAKGAARRTRTAMFPPANPTDLFTHGATDNGRAREQANAEYSEHKRELGVPGMLGDIGAEVAMSALPVSRVGQAIGKAPLLAKALGRMAPAAGDIAANAGYAALATPENRGDAALAGGAGAAAGRVLVRALGGLARPFVSDDARALMDKGVRPTLGQLFGDGPVGSMIRGIEDKATAIPLVGEVINFGRRRSLNEYGNAEINAALKPLGLSVQGAGAEAVAQAERAVSTAYDTVLPQVFLKPEGAMQAILQARQAIANTPLIDGEQKAKVGGYIVSRIRPVIEDAAKNGRAIDGQTAKALDSEIGHYARQYSSSVNPSDHPMGEAFYALQASLRGALQGTTPEATKLLTSTNAAFRNLLPVVKAADRTASGAFTPRQLNRASGQFDQAPSDLNRAAQNVLPSTVPDSGTAGRVLMGGVAGSALGVPAGAAAGLALLYSGPGMRLMVDGLRGVVPDKVVAHLASLPPEGQRTAMQQLAASVPAVGARLKDLAPQVVRALSTQQQQQETTP